MSFCSQCGQALTEGARFCRHCGQPVVAQEDSIPTEWSAPPATESFSPDEPPTELLVQAEWSAPPADESFSPDEPPTELLVQISGDEQLLAEGDGYVLLSTANGYQIWSWENFPNRHHMFPDNEFALSDAGRQAAWDQFVLLEPQFAVASEMEQPVPTFLQADSWAPSTRAAPMAQPPAAIVAVSILMGLTGVAVLVGVAILLKDLWPLPSPSAPTFDKAFVGLVLVDFLIFGSIGVALVAVARMCLRGERAGRALAMVILGLILLSCIIAPVHDVGIIITAILAGCSMLLLGLAPGSQEFFASDLTPVGVMVASTLIFYFAWDYALVGAVLVALHSFESGGDVASGVALLVTSPVLLAVNTSLRRGSETARVVASLALLVAGIVVLIPDHTGLGAFVLPGLAAGALAGLWLSRSSNEFFQPGAALLVNEPRQYAGTVTGVVIVAAMLLYLTAGGSGATPLTTLGNSGNTDTFSPTTAPFSGSSGNDGSSGTGATTAAGSFSQTWSATATASGGYQEDITISAGAPQHFNPNLDNNGAVLGDTCGGNSSTDAVVPVGITIENTTSGFDATGGAALQWGGYSGNSGNSGSGADASMLFQGNYTGGAQCSNNNDGDGNSMSVDSTDSLVPNSDMELYGYFVIANYYSPDDANGDSAFLANTLITVEDDSVVSDSGNSGASGNSGSGSSLDWSITSLSGPGVASGANNFEFDLAGAAVPSGDS
jgi:hypothetical protein